MAPSRVYGSLSYTPIEGVGPSHHLQKVCAIKWFSDVAQGEKRQADVILNEARDLLLVRNDSKSGICVGPA
jgi:hypothetical protein